MGYISRADYLGVRSYDMLVVGVDLYYTALDYSHTTSSRSYVVGENFWRLTARVPLQIDPHNFWIPLLRHLRD